MYIYIILYNCNYIPTWKPALGFWWYASLGVKGDS